MQLTSPAFKQGSEIPSHYTSDGENVSPELSWKDAPANTKSFALVVHDPDASAWVEDVPRSGRLGPAYDRSVLKLHFGELRRKPGLVCSLRYEKLKLRLSAYAARSDFFS